MCEQLDMKLIMPNENPSKDTYHVLKEEIDVGIKPIMNCINVDYLGEEWLGQELNKDTIKELKALADKQEIDVCSEDGRGFHTMVLDAPHFKQRVEISKFKKKKCKEKTKNWKRNWLYMDIKKASLKPK
jgi:diphthamide synthase (EF-2-diphthine--ammonia ligase)